MTDDELAGIKRPSMEGMREIKIKLPIRLILKLHTNKLLKQSPVSRTITDALEEYFRENPV